MYRASLPQYSLRVIGPIRLYWTGAATRCESDKPSAHNRLVSVDASILTALSF